MSLPWDELNRRLQLHGLQSVDVMSPSNVATESVGMEKVIQRNMTRLIYDLDRRQDIIQDLVKSNAILKQDCRQAKVDVTDLRQLLLSAKDKIHEIEAEKQCLQSSILVNNKSGTAEKLADKVDNLQLTCQQQQEQIGQLNKRLKKLLKLKIYEKLDNEENLTGDSRQPKRPILSQIHDSSFNAKSDSTTASTMKKNKLHKHIVVDERIASILKSLQSDVYVIEQIAKLRSQKKHAEKMKDKLRQLEQAIAETCTPAEDTLTALHFQQSIVENLFTVLKVEEEKAALNKIHELKVTSRSNNKLKKFAEEVSSVVNKAESNRCTDNKPAEGLEHEAWCELTYKSTLPKLKKLLSGKIIPNHFDQSLTVGMKNMCPISEHVEYARIIEHLQKLFDVKTVEGIFPRMNEIYLKLGETHNVMHTLKELLGLGETKKSTAIVNAVGRLCEIQKDTTNQQLSQLFQEQDLSNVIVRLKEYERFFPAFEATMNRLMETLSVSSMQEVVAAVQAMKLLAS